MSESYTNDATGGDSYLDPTNELHRANIREAVKRWPRRWAGIDAAKKKKWTDQLECAGDVAETLMNQADDAETKLNAAKTLVSVVKTAAMMEGQNQSDEHKQSDIDNPRSGTQVNILNQNGAIEDPRKVIADMLRDPANAAELAKLADRMGPPNAMRSV